MSQGTWVLGAVLLVATTFGLWRAARDGRFRGTHRLAVTRGEPGRTDPEPGPLQGPDHSLGLDHSLELDHPLGERATLLQFSSAFCAPCRATRRVLGEVAAIVPGVAHIEIDAEQHLDLVRRLGILRTPTTVVLDSQGRELSRASGAPTKQTVLATLGGAV